MKKVVAIFIFVFLFSQFAFLGAEEKEKTVKFDVSVGVGWEFLKYREDIDETNTESDASVNNNIAKADVWVEIKKFVFNASAKLNLITGTGEERWKQNDILIQENDLDYEWTRYDVGVGYVVSPLFKPFIGVRFSDVEQTRKDFVPPLAITKSVEDVESKFYYVGFKSDFMTDQKVDLDFIFKYLEPFDVEVKNSAFPGVKFHDDGGWAFEGELTASYEFSPGWQLEYWAFGGIMHWDGSDLKNTPYGTLKWPENETEYWGIGLGISYKF